MARICGQKLVVWHSFLGPLKLQLAALTVVPFEWFMYMDLLQRRNILSKTKRQTKVSLHNLWQKYFWIILIFNHVGLYLKVKLISNLMNYQVTMIFIRISDTVNHPICNAFFLFSLLFQIWKKVQLMKFSTSNLGACARIKLQKIQKEQKYERRDIILYTVLVEKKTNWTKHSYVIVDCGNNSFSRKFMFGTCFYS